MGGFVRGKVECYISNRDSNFNFQNMFKNLYDFFTSHPQYALVAVNYGSTGGPAASGAGTGTDYCTQITSAGGTTFGNNAFFVVRQNPSAQRNYDVYHLFQFAGAINGTRGTTFGSAPGAPGLFLSTTNGGSNANFCLGYQCAIGISGSGGTVPGNIYGGSSSGSLQNGFGNPWRGGMNALTGVLGIDQKGQTPTGVWGQPVASGSYSAGTGVIIFPRSNDGDTGTFRWSSVAAHFAENCAGLTLGNSLATNDIRMSIIADDDSWVLIYDAKDDGADADVYMVYSGIYNPRNDLPSGSQINITPYCVIMQAAALPWNDHNASTAYGDVAGSSTLQGGVVANVTASVRPCFIERMNNFGGISADANYHPNHIIIPSPASGSFASGSQYGGWPYDELDLMVGIYETTPVQMTGYLGTLDFVRAMYNIQTPSPRWDFNRLFWGGSTIQNYKYSIPWDSQNNTMPRSGVTRQGITFVRPPPA